jgi:hypothetical protein
MWDWFERGVSDSALASLLFLVGELAKLAFVKSETPEGITQLRTRLQSVLDDKKANFTMLTQAAAAHSLCQILVGEQLHFVRNWYELLDDLHKAKLPAWLTPLIAQIRNAT